jgi:selenide,water dikinase
VLVSSNTVDDAGVYLLNDGTAVVFTVDFFTPVVDDPRDFGRIAAANSLSDIYAMGARPLIALNLMCFPDGEMPSSIMTEILLGGQEKVAEAGALILGGHSVRDRELKYGLAVVGTVDPARIVANSGARPGDVLVLTKPIGTGLLATALKNGKLADDALYGMTTLMASLNSAASEAMVESGASAATDVTGFGLVGHARELAEASGVTIEITAADVPLLPGALEAATNEEAPGGLFSNESYYSRFVDASSSLDRHLIDVMYDPQTSGGLLVALPEERLGDFEKALGSRNGRHWVIGRVGERRDRSVVLA